MSTGIAAALSVATVAVSTPAAAAAPVPLLRLAPDDAPSSVLGLSGDDKKAAKTLTTALRKAFANRGISGGEEISLEEMSLTMGCSNDEVSCLAEGGKTLGVGRLVFGYLSPGEGGGYKLDIQILDVATGAFEAQASVDIAKGDLANDKLDATAERVVEALLPTDDGTGGGGGGGGEVGPDPAGGGQGETGGGGEEGGGADQTPRQSSIYFGLEKPTPKWKWMGFGVSLGMTVAAGVATAGMGVWLTSTDGGFRRELLDAAAASLTDGSTTNDVDPNLPEGVNLCEFAEMRPVDANGQPLGEPGQVRNQSVVGVCTKADRIKSAQLATGIGTAVFGVATLAFTGLLLVHKRKPTVDAMLRHGVQLGVAPMIDTRGVTLSGGLRF